MRYITIDDGSLTQHEADDWRDITAAVGPEGWNRVQLARNLAAYVNDCGHVLPEKYVRNLTGSLTLIALGAAVMPYAGPVVISGWDPTATGRGGIEIVGLTAVQAEMVSVAWWLACEAAGGQETVAMWRVWRAEAVRELSGIGRDVAEAPTPTMRVL